MHKPATNQENYLLNLLGTMLILESHFSKIKINQFKNVLKLD